jgi:hypothetical protein
MIFPETEPRENLNPASPLLSPFHVWRGEDDPSSAVAGTATEGEVWGEAKAEA